jgi:hypothetical protein
MEVSFLDFNNWFISSSYNDTIISWENPISISGEGESAIVNSHLNTILNISTPSGSFESGSYGYGTDHYETIDITNEVINAYSGSL